MTEQIIVFTDGSHIKGTNKCGYGIYFPNKELPNVSRSFDHPPITHQRAELYAIFKAIYYITKKLTVNKIIIYTDSKYSMDSLTVWIKKWKKNNWKTVTGSPVKNVDIIREIDNQISNFKGKIEFIHVSAHTNKQDFLSISNHMADVLAKAGANSKKD